MSSDLWLSRTACTCIDAFESKNKVPGYGVAEWPGKAENAAYLVEAERVCAGHAAR